MEKLYCLAQIAVVLKVLDSLVIRMNAMQASLSSPWLNSQGHHCLLKDFAVRAQLRTAYCVSWVLMLGRVVGGAQL